MAELYEIFRQERTLNVPVIMAVVNEGTGDHTAAVVRAVDGAGTPGVDQQPASTLIYQFGSHNVQNAVDEETNGDPKVSGGLFHRGGDLNLIVCKDYGMAPKDPHFRFRFYTGVTYGLDDVTMARQYLVDIVDITPEELRLSRPDAHLCGTDSSGDKVYITGMKGNVVEIGQDDRFVRINGTPLNGVHSEVRNGVEKLYFLDKDGTEWELSASKTGTRVPLENTDDTFMMDTTQTKIYI